MIHGAFTADLPTCHRQVHTVAHPGGDDVDERGNRRRHQPKPARLRLRADRGLRGWLRRYLLALIVSTATGSARRAGLRTRWQRYATSRPAPTSRSSRVTLKPVSTRFGSRLMDRVRRRIGDKRVLANVESTLIAPAIFSGRSASRFAGCIGTFERRQRTRIDLSGSSAGDARPLTRCPVAVPFALLSAA